MVVNNCKMFRFIIYLLPLSFLYQVICANEGTRWIKSDLSELTKAADSGDAYAQGFLALCHLHGDKGLNVSHLEARFYAESSASRGHWLGNFVVGHLTRYKPLGPDPAKVAKYLLKSFRDPDGKLIKHAAIGDPIAAYVLAEIFIAEEIEVILQPDMKMAAAYYEISADSGYAPACVQSALINIHSLADSMADNSNNMNSGISLLKKAVDQKLPAAHYYLGRSFLEGHGVKVDKELAFVHFLAAAERDYGPAYIIVADFYAYGVTGEPNKELAIQYIERAIELHEEGAEAKLEEYMSYFGDSTNETADIPEAEPLEKIIDHTPTIAQAPTQRPVVDPLKGDVKSFRIPSAYSQDEKINTPVLDEEMLPSNESNLASRITEASIDQIRESAKKIYWGRSTDSSMAQAFQSFEKCAKLGDAESARYLGIMYMRGKGVNKSAHEAIKWFEVAAKQGDNLAEKNLLTLRKIMKL